MQIKVIDKRQETKLNMFHVVIVLCDGKITIVNTNVAFKDSFTDFKAIVAQIDGNVQRAGEKRTGFAVDKKNSAGILCENASTVGGYLRAFAAKTGNNALKDAVDYSESDLSHLKDGELAPVCQQIHDRAVENKDALAPYNVTTAKLAALQTQIDDYVANATKPREAAIDRKGLKELNRQLVKQADNILKEQMDLLIKDFNAADPQFVIDYKNARIVIDAKTGKKVNEMNPGGNTSNPPA
jgi:uncharacterized coiled-coil protein SlyX